MIRSNFLKLRQIFLYYDSEPMEVLQGIIWLLFFVPITILDSGFHVINHPLSIGIGLAQLFCVLNCSLKTRKIMSFLVFLWSVAITTWYFINQSMIKDPIYLVFLFISIFAFFNLRRLSIENIKQRSNGWIQ